MSKRSKHIPTDIYFYLAIQLSKCIMRLNMRVGPVRTQMTNMQNMKNSCEILLYYPKIGGEDIKYCVKKEIINILHTNIDIHIIRLISEFPVDGVKFISKLQYHCANITFYGKIIYDRIFQQVTHKGE